MQVFGTLFLTHSAVGDQDSIPKFLYYYKR
jgi:hypothetical protein